MRIGEIRPSVTDTEGVAEAVFKAEKLRVRVMQTRPYSIVTRHQIGKMQ